MVAFNSKMIELVVSKWLPINFAPKKMNVAAHQLIVAPTSVIYFFAADVLNVLTKYCHLFFCTISYCVLDQFR